MREMVNLGLVLVLLVPVAWFGIQAIAVLIGLAIIAAICECVITFIAHAWRMIR